MTVNIARSRKLRVAGCAAAGLGVLGLLTVAQGAGAVRPTLSGRPSWDVQTRDACDAVTGRRVRCTAVEVLNPVRGRDERQRPHPGSGAAAATHHHDDATDHDHDRDDHDDHRSAPGRPGRARPPTRATRRATSGRRTRSRRRPVRVRRSRSSTPTTTRTPSRIWRCTGPRTACRRARPRTDASGRSTRAEELRVPAADRRLGGGDLPRPRHGLGRLPGLPHPARRGELEQLVELVDRREPGGRSARPRSRTAGPRASSARSRRTTATSTTASRSR